MERFTGEMEWIFSCESSACEERAGRSRKRAGSLPERAGNPR